MSSKEHLLPHFRSYLESPNNLCLPPCFLLPTSMTLYIKYRTITSADDYTALQEDIDAVSSCLASKHLNLNNNKCCFMLLSRKRTHTVSPPLMTINGALLAHVQISYKYLGVLITTDLMWTTHETKACIKTRGLVGLLHRRFSKYSFPNTLIKLYRSFIRPHLEYTTAAWDPYLIKDVTELEDV